MMYPCNLYIRTSTDIWLKSVFSKIIVKTLVLLQGLFINVVIANGFVPISTGIIQQKWLHGTWYN